MRKFLSLTVAVFMAAMTFGQSYGILVNGTTYYAGSAVGEYEGFTQYLAHVPLQAGDYCQLYDADNEAAWAVTLNTYSVAGFTKNNDRYDVSVSGCYDFYIKLKYGADELYIGTGSDCGEGVNINEEDLTVVYDWAGNVGTTILGTGGKVTVSTTKIHTNQDVVDAVKFEKSFVYAEGHYMAIKPAEGKFKAGDSITFSAVFNNANADGTKFVQVDFYAADGATRLFRGDSVVNGQKDAADPNVEGFKLAADQDSIFIGRYGNTNMFLTLLKVTRAAETPEPPVEDPAKFYVTGDSALVTDAGFPGKAWNPAAIKSEADTLPLSLKAGQTYSLKITLNGEWATAKGYNDLTEKPNGTSADNDGNIVFALTEAGIVNVIYIAGEEPVFKIEGSFVENEPQPIVENGFYLVGSMNEWTAAAAYLFTVNPENENEYVLDVNLTEGDELKVKKVEAGQPDVWYPGEGGNYVVDANHAGATTMYFQVDYKEEWAAFGGYFYIVPTSTVDITNTNADVKVVKVLRDGQLLIIKGDKMYNVMGAVVR